jgi:hypothetical protein
MSLQNPRQFLSNDVRDGSRAKPIHHCAAAERGIKRNRS